MADTGTPVPSPEVAAVLQRIILAARDRDVETNVNLHSRSSFFRHIGTDSGEFWDAEAFIPVLGAQLEELPAFDVTLSHLEAYQLGEFAWGAAIAEVEFEDGRSVEIRQSAVFMIEDGVWRCVQSHRSVPTANEETMGVSLPKTLDDLLDSLDADTLSPIESSEGTATLVFTDIVDSTVIAQEMGDRRWKDTIEDHDQFIAGTVGRHGGNVIKTLGDGALVAFAGARTALRCTVDLQAGFVNRPFFVRIGVHSGEVVRSRDDIIGVTVHKAARVTAAAAGGQIVVSAIVRELVGDTEEFSFGDPFLVELKGIDGVHELVPLEL